MPHRGLTPRRRRERMSPFEWPSCSPHSHRLGLAESRRESPMCLPRTTARMEWPRPRLSGREQVPPAKLASPRLRTQAMPPLRPPMICLDPAPSTSRAAASERAERAATNAPAHRRGTVLQFLPLRRWRECIPATGQRGATTRASPVARVCRAGLQPVRVPGTRRLPPSQSTVRPLTRPRQRMRSGSEMRSARMRHALSATKTSSMRSVRDVTSRGSEAHDQTDSGRARRRWMRMKVIDSGHRVARQS